MSVATGGATVEEATLIEDAWGIYLDTVRTVDPLRYDEVEPLAWANLQARLTKISEAHDG